MSVIVALLVQRALSIAGMSRNDLEPSPTGKVRLEVILFVSRAPINLQLESAPHTIISSSQSTVQGALHVGAIGSSPFMPRGPIDLGSPGAGQNPQPVTSGPRRNTLILANPIISIPPH